MAASLEEMAADSGRAGVREWASPQTAHRGNLLGPGVAEAVGGVVVDHPCRLHVGVADRRADELEAALQQGLAHGVGLGRFWRGPAWGRRGG